MELQNWINEARAHWKEFLPNRYREFEEAGVLDEALQDAAERTAFEMGQFQRCGLTWDEAWERTRQEYIYLPPEPKEKARLDREPSPNVSAQMFNTAADLQSEMLQKMNDEE